MKAVDASRFEVNTLADLRPGQIGIVRGIKADASLKRRLAAMGLVSGTTVSVEYTAPMGNPRAYLVRDYTLSLRNEEARKVVIDPRV